MKIGRNKWRNAILSVLVVCTLRIVVVDDRLLIGVVDLKQFLIEVEQLKSGYAHTIANHQTFLRRT